MRCNYLNLPLYRCNPSVDGANSHLAADALNPAGIRPFVLQPSKEYALNICQASNPLANRLLIALGGVLTVLAIGAGVLVRSAAV